MAIYFRGMLLADFVDLVDSIVHTNSISFNSDIIDLCRDTLELEAENDELRKTLAALIPVLENGLERSFALDAKISELKRKYGLDSKAAFCGVM